MHVPRYGASPLAQTFIYLRVVALLAMFAIIGMTANAVATTLRDDDIPPAETGAALILVGLPHIARATLDCSLGGLTHRQTCFATFYALLSLPFFCAKARRTLFVMAVADFVSMLAYIVIVVIFSPAVSALTCNSIDTTYGSAQTDSESLLHEYMSPGLEQERHKLGLMEWTAANTSQCRQTKAVWGLAIIAAMCFAASGCVLPTLFFKTNRYEIRRFRRNCGSWSADSY